MNEATKIVNRFGYDNVNAIRRSAGLKSISRDRARRLYEMSDGSKLKIHGTQIKIIDAPANIS